MALNLFQKYRPPSFQDVVGHEVQVKEFIKRAKDKNFPQCIYITGYTGTGKTVLSRIIAKCLLCRKLDSEGNPCNSCKECEAINNEQRILNYFEENGSNFNIDRAREVEELSQKKIMMSDSSIKVFYIDEIQEIASKSKEALKNLLKLLEKPSKNNYFILGSMDDSSIPEAVRNRCVTYKLKLLTPEQIAERLLYICNQEKIEIDTEEKANVILTISENSQGSLRTAISYLERVIYSDIWKETQVIEELELFSSAQINQIISETLCSQFKSEKVFNKSLLDTIIYRLVMLYKYLVKVELTPYQLSIIKNIGLPSKNERENIKVIENTLSKLYELYRYTYLTQPLIDYVIINIKVSNEELCNKEIRIERAPRR